MSFENPIELLPLSKAGLNSMDKIKTPRNRSREAFNGQIGPAKMLKSKVILPSVELNSTPPRDSYLQIIDFENCPSGRHEAIRRAYSARTHDRKRHAHRRRNLMAVRSECTLIRDRRSADGKYIPAAG